MFPVRAGMGSSPQGLWTETSLGKTKEGRRGWMSFLTLHSVYRDVYVLALQRLNSQALVYIKTEMMTALSCSVPTVTSHSFKCWLAIWYCFMSLSIKPIDNPALSAACGWSARIAVCACNMNIEHWYDYSTRWSLCARWCEPSSYAYADCSRDWAVYVRDALKEALLDWGNM